MEFYCAHCNKLRDETEMVSQQIRRASGGFRTIHFCTDTKCFSEYSNILKVRTRFRKNEYSRIHRHY